MRQPSRTRQPAIDPAAPQARSPRAAPRNQVRPTGIFVIAVLLALILDRVAPLYPLPAGVAMMWIGGVLIAAGAVLTTVCLLFFERIGTGIMPDRPARRLVTTGPYSWSRNPMFVGFALMQAGVALLLGSTWSLLLLPAAIAITTITVIKCEEGYMRRQFGAEYDVYAWRVRRWIGRRAVPPAHPALAADRTREMERPRPSPARPRHTLTP